MRIISGKYKGRRISVMGSGMGMPSIGIYSYELFDVYGVENIIRIGSCGSYSDKVNVYDVIVADGAYSESSSIDTPFIGVSSQFFPERRNIKRFKASPFNSCFVLPER